MLMTTEIGKMKMECKIERVVLCVIVCALVLYCYNISSQKVTSDNSGQCAPQPECKCESQRTEPQYSEGEKPKQGVMSLTATDIWNRHKIDYDPELRAEFELLLSQGVSSKDKQLVDLVRRLLDPPSTHIMRKPAHAIFQTPQAKAVDSLYDGQVSC